MAPPREPTPYPTVKVTPEARPWTGGMRGSNEGSSDIAVKKMAVTSPACAKRNSKTRGGKLRRAEGMALRRDDATLPFAADLILRPLVSLGTLPASIEDEYSGYPHGRWGLGADVRDLRTTLESADAYRDRVHQHT